MRISVFTCICICIALSQQALAQETKPIVINPKIGINFSDLIFSTEPANTSSLAEMGWNVGIDANYGNKCQAKGGIHYFQLGSGVQMPRDTQVVSASQLKIPMGVGFRVLAIDYFHLWLHSQAVVNFTTKMRRGNMLLDSEDYPRTGLAGRLGIGMDLWKITLELNYEYSFTDIVNESIFARNEMISLSLGIKI